MYPRTVHKPTFKPSRKKTTEYPKPWKGTTRLFQGHTIPHGLRLGILSNAGNHWFLHGWITPVLGHRYGGHCKTEPVLEEPDLVCLDWNVRRFKEKYLKPIMTFECFHAGTTTSVRKSTIRTTARGGNAALIMESDSGEYFVAISKAQGCDEIKILDPNFIGWVRRYGGPFYGETWEQIDTDVDKFLCDISGEESDEE